MISQVKRLEGVAFPFDWVGTVELRTNDGRVFTGMRLSTICLESRSLGDWLSILVRAGFGKEELLLRFWINSTNPDEVYEIEAKVGGEYELLWSAHFEHRRVLRDLEMTDKVLRKEWRKRELRRGKESLKGS